MKKMRFYLNYVWIFKRISEDRNILKSIFSDFLVQQGYDRVLIEEEMRNLEIVVSQKQLCSK